MPTVKELKEEARQLGLKGISKLNKTKLQKLIKDHRDSLVDEIASKDSEDLSEEDIEILTDWVEDVKQQVDDEKIPLEEQDTGSIDDDCIDNSVRTSFKFFDDESSEVSSLKSSAVTTTIVKNDSDPTFVKSIPSSHIESKIEEVNEVEEDVQESISLEQATHFICGSCNRINLISLKGCRRCGGLKELGVYIIR